MGSAAAYQLSKRGVNVLGIDQFNPPHVKGSTHGETRITRLAMGEGVAYTPIAIRSHEIWRELEALTGKSLLTITGSLIITPTKLQNSLHGKSDFLEQTLLSAEKYGIAHELFRGKEITRRFPQFLVSDDEVAFFEHDAGFVRPELCVQVQLDLARSNGADIHTDEKVMTFTPQGDGVLVVTEAGEYFAEHLIVSAGPWISDFLNPEYRPLVNVYRQVLYWFSVHNAAHFAPSEFPVFIWDLGGGDDMYGFPAIDGADGGIKIATEKYIDPTTPDSVVRTVSEEETMEMFEKRIHNRLIGVQDICLKAATCLYSVTPDDSFIIDFLPDFPQVIIASPCSGHGFKHSAGVGEILADLATKGHSALDISPFGFNRFDPTRK